VVVVLFIFLIESQSTISVLGSRKYGWESKFILIKSISRNSGRGIFIHLIESQSTISVVGS